MEWDRADRQKYVIPVYTSLSSLSMYPPPPLDLSSLHISPDDDSIVYGDIDHGASACPCPCPCPCWEGERAGRGPFSVSCDTRVATMMGLSIQQPAVVLMWGHRESRWRALVALARRNRAASGNGCVGGGSGH